MRFTPYNPKNSKLRSGDKGNFSRNREKLCLLRRGYTGFKIPKNTERFVWTKHSVEKMRYYQLSEARLKRVINNPKRKELGIAPGTVAIMQPTGSKKHPTEIWLMYQPIKSKVKSSVFAKASADKRQLKVITAWRYPGKSPIHGPIPIPEEILEELGEMN